MVARLESALRARRARACTMALAGACCLALALAACNKTPTPAQNAATAAAENTASGPVAATSASPPPALPDYSQPPLPAPGYIWTPGNWSWDDADSDYYWVPGTWVEPPSAGLLWTPGYWALEDGRYAFHLGYWGPQVGFYGGLDYGYGYGGQGYQGGRWQGRSFYYNSAVSNLGAAPITNVYRQAVSGHGAPGHASWNGAGGVAAQPTADELATANQRHWGADLGPGAAGQPGAD